MRNFQTLDTAEADEATGILHVTSQHATTEPRLALRREGDYVAFSASYGPLEMALRPRYQELTWTLSRLQPVEGLQTSRHIGTGSVQLAVGLASDGALYMRPMLIGDATGHLSFNLILTPAVYQKLLAWLGVSTDSQ